MSANSDTGDRKTDFFETENVELKKTESGAAQANEQTMPPEIVALFAKFEGERARKLTRKMDLHLIPIVSTDTTQFALLDSISSGLGTDTTSFQLTLLYLFAYLDRFVLHLVPVAGTCSNSDHRGNIGNARIAGMQADLGLTDQQYNAALTIFFVSYCVFEVPSNVLLKKLKPKLWSEF